MAPSEPDEPSAEPDIRKKEDPTPVHNAWQVLGCMPVLGSLAVGICGLVAFLAGANQASIHNQPNDAVWLLAGCVGLIASGIGFGVLAWLLWRHR
jgi:hypothetical protein